MRVADSRFNRNYWSARLWEGTLCRFWYGATRAGESAARPGKGTRWATSCMGEGTGTRLLPPELPPILQRSHALALGSRVKGSWVPSGLFLLYGDTRGGVPAALTECTVQPSSATVRCTIRLLAGRYRSGNSAHRGSQQLSEVATGPSDWISAIPPGWGARVDTLGSFIIALAPHQFAQALRAAGEP